MFFQCAKLKYAIPIRWKTLSNYSDIEQKNLYQNHNVIKEAINKLSSKEIYLILISNIFRKPTSNVNFEKLFENTTLDWSKVYLSRHLATTDTTLHSCQYKILNNTIFLYKKLYNFGTINTDLCSLCKTFKETPMQIFYDCIQVKSVREKLETKFQNDIILSSLTPQLAILGLTNEANKIDNLPNHFLCYVSTFLNHFLCYYVYR